MKKHLFSFVVIFPLLGCNSPKNPNEEARQENEILPAVIIETKQEADTVKPSDMYSNALDLPEFRDCTDFGGALISDDYGVHVLQNDKKRITYLLFDELSARNNSGMPLWKLLDTLQLQGTELNIGWTGNVMLNGRIDNELIVLLPDDIDWIDTEIFDMVKQAWRFDRIRKKIIEIPVKGIRCKNDMYGID